MIDLFLARLRNEPAVAVGVLVAGIIFLAGEFGIVLDEASLKEVLTPVVTAVIARFVVSPAVPEKVSRRLRRKQA